MLLQVAVMVLVFLARICFSRTKSIAAIIRSRYGNKILKIGFKLKRAKFDIKFLWKCKINEFTHIFFVFKQLIKI